MEFFFWRSGRPVDVSNLVKSTEDALQGALYDNDRLVRRVAGEMVEQSPKLDSPGVLIRASDRPETGLSQLPETVFTMLTVTGGSTVSQLMTSLEREDDYDDF